MNVQNWFRNGLKGGLQGGFLCGVALVSSLSSGDRAMARDRYLEANPSAAYYIDFGDFVFYT